MRGKLFFVAIGACCLGIVVRTVYSVPVPLGVLVTFISVLCLVFFGTASERGQREVVMQRIGIVLLFGMVGIIRTSFAPVSIPPPLIPLLDQKVVLSGIIVADPDLRELSTRLTVETTTPQTKVIAVVPAYEHFSIGEKVQLRGILKAPQPFTTDGGRTFAYDKFLAMSGIFAVIQPASVSVVGARSGLVMNVWAALLSIKAECVRALQIALPEPYSALAVGLIAGGKQGLGKSLLAAFTVAGLLQIVVLSGYNVMIVAEGIVRSLSRFPKSLALAMAILGIAAFVIAAGANSSAIRAGIMATLALVARGSSRTYEVLRALFATLFIMLMMNPLLLVYDPGFQFSFAATVGMIVLSPLVSVRLLWMTSVFVREMFATTIAAQLAVLPILLWQSGNLSLVALPANVLVMPLIPPAMAFSAGAAVIAWFLPSLGPLAGLPAYSLLWAIIEIAKVSAALPFAQVIIPAFSFFYVVVMYGLLFALFRWMKNHPPGKSSVE